MTSLTLAPAIALSDRQFEQLCRQNPDMNVEMSARGVLTMTPPVGFEGGNRESQLNAQVALWAMEEGSGLTFSSQTLFHLPNGAKYMPDVAWVRRDRLQSLTPEQKRGFAPIAPDFAIELRSPSDLLSDLQDKMLDYIDGGVRLAWLIDPLRRVVEIYSLDGDRQVLDNPTSVSGDPILPGFSLQLEPLFAELR
ncbi:Uma2 family endonuclease [Synechococcus sp. PCC 7336]|uniref:Uma2 family endonuclease n=1 Tax=Synechococcus sp. PCC 7336 TaxID=195250 RepID=UPI00034CE952|nr:Uma2 family endonuclease [Synechococcus sp. PCC 7336]